MPETRNINTADPIKHRALRGVVFDSRWILPVVLILAGTLLFSYSVWGSALRHTFIPAPASPVVNAQQPKPTQISIPSIRLTAMVAEVGLNPDKTLETPADAAQVGWYVGSV